MRKRAPILLVLATIATSCASTTLTDAGRRTTLVQDSSAMSTCRDLGPVSGDGTESSGDVDLTNVKSGHASGGNQESFAEIDLRNAAGKLGATHVVVLAKTPSQFVDRSRDDGVGHKMHLDGRAYRCSAGGGGVADPGS